VKNRRPVSWSILVVAVLGLAIACAPTPTPQGLKVADGRVIASGGHSFIMRGVNYPYAWYRHQALPFGELKSLGANTVRVVLSNGDRWPRTEPDEVETIISECWEHRLVCVLEVHDTTGYGEAPNATTLARAVDYWLSLQEALAGTEHYVIINVANEPFGNIDDAPWAVESSAAIARLRGAGFPHMLMIDGPNWGQDWEFVMRDSATEVLANDPLRNVLFSIHAYEVFADPSRIASYLESFVADQLPIVIGEFGATHPKGDPNEDAIMAIAQRLGIGYLGWSWSGNAGEYKSQDIVLGFDVNRMTGWGERLFHGPDGIGQTAQEASVYAKRASGGA
jgi:mannan endo-1,4-beta-mannosidase